MIHRFKNLLKRFHRDENGAFLVLFGVLAIVLVATAGAVVDYSAMEQGRTRAQVALDAASLGLQPQIYTATTDALTTQAKALVLERLGDSWTICATVPVPPCATVDPVIVDKPTGMIRIEASITVPMAFVALVGIDKMTAGVASETIRGSVNIEVALALDTTGSMAGTRIVDLRAATQDFIDLVVNTVQTPTYSKVALVPYSIGVNAGTYATAARGTPRAATTVTGAAWWATTNGAARNITGATKANPVVITANGHGYFTGEYVYITGVPGMTQLNGKVYRVGTVPNANTFQLQTVAGVNVNGLSYTTFATTTPRGTVRKCLGVACEIVVTSTAHGMVNGEIVRIASVGGMTQLNNDDDIATTPPPNWTVSNKLTNTFQLSGTVGPTSGYGTYSSGGSAQCAVYGCQRLSFQSPDGNWNYFTVSTCVTERTVNAYTDASPTTTPVGMNYPSTGNGCVTRPIVPLSADKGMLTTQAGLLTAGGSTGGHIGVEWAWHMVSPNFASLFVTASKPALYTAPNTQKIVVIMTDGEYNSPYCKGAIAADATSGSGSSSDHINCNAPNGSAYVQAEAQCAAMKAAGVVVYSVGFQIISAPAATSLLTNCASDSSKLYLAATGQQLKDAFKAIGQNIGELRVSK